MAYISAIDDEEEDKPAAAVGAAPPVAGATAPAPVAAQQPAAAPQASRFVNFSQFLNANRGSAQATAGRIAGGINKQGTQAETGLATAQGQFTRDVKAGSSDPSKLYSGPSSLSEGAGWAGLQDNARGAQDNAAATATPGGLGAILQRQNQGAYGGGNRRLDTALTGHVGADQFADARAKYGKLSDALNTANTSSVTTADTARTDAKTANDKYVADAATKAANDAATKQITDDTKVLDDVGPIIWEGMQGIPEHLKSDWLRTNEPMLRAKIDAKFGPGAWERYVAARDRRAQGIRGAVTPSPTIGPRTEQPGVRLPGGA